MDSVANVSERSERTAGRASASEPGGDGVWGRSPHDMNVSERSERTAGRASASEPMVPVRDDLQALRATTRRRSTSTSG